MGSPTRNTNFHQNTRRLTEFKHLNRWFNSIFNRNWTKLFPMEFTINSVIFCIKGSVKIHVLLILCISSIALESKLRILNIFLESIRCYVSVQDVFVYFAYIINVFSCNWIIAKHVKFRSNRCFHFISSM